MKLSVISIALIPMLSLSAVQAAVYDVVEVGDVAEVKTTAAAAINDAGEVVFNGGISEYSTSAATEAGYTYKRFSSGDANGYYNFPLDLSLIDFTSEIIKNALSDEQLADAQNGVTDAFTLNYLLNYNPALQPIGLALPYIKTVNAEAENVVLRDETTAPMRGNSEYLYDINNQSVAIGVASTSFTRQSFTPEPTEAVPEPATKYEWLFDGPMVLGSVVKDGIVTTIPAPYQNSGGGYSLAYAINNNGYIVGMASTSIIDEAKIAEKCDGKNESETFCRNKLIMNTPVVINPLSPGQQTGRLLLSDHYYQPAGMMWHFADNMLSEPTMLGFLGDLNTGIAFDGEELNRVSYFSTPYDINDNGLAVGASVYTDSTQEVYLDQTVNGNYVKGIFRTFHASLFTDGQALPLVEPNDWLRSSAIAINNNNIIIGGALKVINNEVRTRMFIHDYNLGTTNFVESFFASANTFPRDINDNNIAVGTTEAILNNTLIRRPRAFVMDLTDNSFVDLNTLVSCDSPFTLVDANSINNHGEILATAIVKKSLRDIKGEIVLDSNGVAQTENVTTTVKLIPIANGEAEVCSGDDTSYKRKSGSFSFAWLLGFFFIGWRRLQR
ncbi:DUF3466 family protein [Rheinheimera sp. WS51]|uniref:DUF3466 family protein n=1 Tax=Rheinheimera sp. WS51 TaxID=3425886 RepID=UPI003D8CBD2A